MDENETILLKRFSTQADAEAFAELVRRYVRLVYSTSWRVLKDEGDAADVTQETFFELTRHAGHISGSLSSWLHQIATRKSIDLIRRSVHRRRREQAYARTQPEDVQTWHDLSGYVDEALDKLDESTKSLLLEHFLAGKTTTEIARDQGVSQATVSRRINDGLEQLRGALRRQGLLVAAGALGTLLMENASQAVPAAVLGELSKMAMVGTTGAATVLGGKAAAAIHAGAVKAMFATATVVAVVSVVGLHSTTRAGPSRSSDHRFRRRLVRQPTQPNEQRSIILGQIVRRPPIRRNPKATHRPPRHRLRQSCRRQGSLSRSHPRSSCRIPRLSAASPWEIRSAIFPPST